jgi:hypothetical protein
MSGKIEEIEEIEEKNWRGTGIGEVGDAGKPREDGLDIVI